MYTNEINSISATNKCPKSTEAAKGLPKGNFRTNEGLLRALGLQIGYKRAET